MAGATATMMVADPLSSTSAHSALLDASSSSAFEMGLPDAPVTDPSHSLLDTSRYPGIRVKQTFGTVTLTAEKMVFEPDEDDSEKEEEIKQEEQQEPTETKKKTKKEAVRSWKWTAIDKHDLITEPDANGDQVVPVMRLFSKQAKVVKLYVCAGCNIAEALHQDVDRRVRHGSSTSTRRLAVENSSSTTGNMNNHSSQKQPARQLADTASPSQKKILYQRGSIMVFGGPTTTDAAGGVEDPSPKPNKLTSMFSSKKLNASAKENTHDDDHDEEQQLLSQKNSTAEKKNMFALFTPAGTKHKVLMDEDEEEKPKKKSSSSSFKVSDLLTGCILAPPKAVRDRQENLRTFSPNVGKPSMLQVLLMAPPPKRTESRRNVMRTMDQSSSRRSGGGRKHPQRSLNSSSHNNTNNGRQSKSRMGNSSSRRSHSRRHEDEHSERSEYDESSQGAFDESAASRDHIVHGRRHPTKQHHHAIDNSVRSSSSTTPAANHNNSSVTAKQPPAVPMSLGRRLSLIVTPQKAAEEMAKEEAQQRELEAALREAEEKRVFFAPTAPTKTHPKRKAKSALDKSATDHPNDQPKTPDQKERPTVTWSPSNFEVDRRNSKPHSQRNSAMSNKSDQSSNRARHVRSFAVDVDAPASAPTPAKLTVAGDSNEKLPFAPFAMEEDDTSNDKINGNNKKERRNQMSKEASQLLQNPTQALEMFQVQVVKDDTTADDPSIGVSTNIFSTDGQSGVATDIISVEPSEDNKADSSSIAHHKQLLETSQANLEKLASLMALVKDEEDDVLADGKEGKAETDKNNKKSTTGKSRPAANRRSKQQPPPKGTTASPMPSAPSRLVVDGSLGQGGIRRASTSDTIRHSNSANPLTTPQVPVPSSPSKLDPAKKSLSYYRDTYFSKNAQTAASGLAASPLKPMFRTEGLTRRGSASSGLSFETPEELQARHHRFVLLRHASTCTCQNIDNGSTDSPMAEAPKERCKLDPECSELKVVLRHIRTCDNPCCVFPNCRDSKALLLALHQQTQQSRRLRQLQQMLQDKNSPEAKNLWNQYTTAMGATPPLKHVEVSDNDENEADVVSDIGSFCDTSASAV